MVTVAGVGAQAALSQIIKAFMTGAVPAPVAAPEAEAPSALSTPQDIAALAALLAPRAAAPIQAARPPVVLSILGIMFPLATFGVIIGLGLALTGGASIGEAQTGLVVALSICIGVLIALTCAVVNAWAAPAPQEGRGAPIAPPATLPPPVPDKPASASPPEPVGPSGKTVTIRGKASWFGGPDDRTMKPDEGLALIERSRLDDFPALQKLFLPAPPPGVTGLGRQLNPDTLYCAARWDYSQTPKSWLRKTAVVARNPATGKTVIGVQPIDWGPGERTGRAIDVSPALAEALGIKTDDICELIVPLPEPAAPVLSDAPGGPPWLARMVALRGLYERSGSADNPVILEMARACGGQISATYKHDEIPWCALAVGYVLHASGYPTTDSLLALSYTKYGRRLSGPAVGAIAAKKRDGGGHVFLVLGRDSAGRIVGIGGNQSDMVCDEEFDAEAIVSYTWPEDAPLPSKVGSGMTDVSVLPIVAPTPKVRRDVVLQA